MRGRDDDDEVVGRWLLAWATSATVISTAARGVAVPPLTSTWRATLGDQQRGPGSPAQQISNLCARGRS